MDFCPVKFHLPIHTQCLVTLRAATIMHYLKLDRCVHIGHIVANVTFFFTLAIAGLGVEIGGMASRERNRETTASGGRERENPFSPFSSSVFFSRSGSYFAPPLTI